MLELGTIRNLLSSEIKPYIDDVDTKHAAVMVVIYGKDNSVVMTKKPITMSQHAGEIAFPGGKMSAGDADLLDTALRETREEISLEMTRSEVIGQLVPVRTRNSGFTIIPFVSVLEQIPELRPNSEVDAILHIPLVPFLKTLGLDDDQEHRSLFEAYKLTYAEHIVWGASARILKQISDIFKQGSLL